MPPREMRITIAHPRAATKAHARAARYTVPMRNLRLLMLWLVVAVLCACGNGAPPPPPSAPALPSAWIRLGPPDAMMLAGYLGIDNASDTPLQLQRVDSDAFGAIEVHRTEVVDGVSSMREVPDLIVPPHARVVLEPGAMHLMLMQPTRPLHEGDRVMVRLHWNQGDALRTDSVFFDVRRDPPTD